MSGRVHPLTTLQGSSGIPNYGAFLGTSASIDLLNSINQQVGATFFGQNFNDVTTAFMRDIIVPMQQAVEQIRITAEVLLNPDVIRPLLHEEDFLVIPPIMQLPILLYAPVRDLFNRGRIEGFGYNQDYLPEDDVYAHILASGRVEDVLAAMDKDGMVRFHWEMHSDDVPLTSEEKRSIRDTREAIDAMLRDTSYDPTSYPDSRG